MFQLKLTDEEFENLAQLVDYVVTNEFALDNRTKAAEFSQHLEAADRARTHAVITGSTGATWTLERADGTEIRASWFRSA